jgi:hypothetical protein
MLTSRERVKVTLNHQQPDRVPLDLGGTPVTGMHASSVYALRQALGLDSPGTPVKVIDPYQILGEIKPDLREALGVDVVGVRPPRNFFGFKNEDWKEWKLPDGTPVLVPGLFNTEPEPDGSILQYPQGDRSVPASGRMPKGGFYFDAIVRQPPVEDDKLDPADNLEEFQPISDEELAYFEREVRQLYEETDKAIVANFGGTAFGDISLVPATSLKHPKGIRDIEEWYVSTLTRKDYIYEVFERQCEIALANLKKLSQMIGDRILVIYVTGTDFGTQEAPFLSVESYRDLFFPFHKKVCDWVHQHTSWKTFMHSDGSMMPLLPSIAEAGIDILNPVQWTAKNMNPQTIKDRFGDQFVFWGGGVDTQGTLPFGTPDEVRKEVKKHLHLLGRDGGYVFSSVHNIQPQVPTENLRAYYEAFAADRTYPLK